MGGGNDSLVPGTYNLQVHDQSVYSTHPGGMAAGMACGWQVPAPVAALDATATIEGPTTALESVAVADEAAPPLPVLTCVVQPQFVDGAAASNPSALQRSARRR